MRNRQKFVRLIQQNLTPTLLSAKFRAQKHPLGGHCYVASEALYHLLGGKNSGMKPMFLKHEGQPHWYLFDTRTNVVVDLTAAQFQTPIPYANGRGKGFLTGQPSKRAVSLMREISKCF